MMSPKHHLLVLLVSYLALSSGMITAGQYFFVLTACSIFILFYGNAYSFLANLVLVVANLQLGVAPVWYYDYFQGSDLSRLWLYEMAVDKEHYCEVLAQLLFFFHLGLILPQFRKLEEVVESKDLNGYRRRLSRLFFIIGMVSWVLWVFVLTGQGSFYLLLGKRMILVFFLYRIYQDAPKTLHGLFSNYSFLFFVIVTLSEALSGMYGELLIEIILLAAVLIKIDFLKPRLRLIGLMVFAPMILILQLSKQEIRERSWQGDEDIIVSTIEALESNLHSFEDKLGRDFVRFGILSRLNQGRIMSHVLAWKENTPSDSLNENRIWQALKISLIPRFLWPDKPSAGGADNIRQYTNVAKASGTSMNIGYFSDFIIALGDMAYLGLFVFSFIAGRILIKLCEFRDIIGLYLLATVFSALAQIETDFFMVLNQIVKVLVLFGLITFLGRRNWI